MGTNNGACLLILNNRSISELMIAEVYQRQVVGSHKPYIALTVNHISVYIRQIGTHLSYSLKDMWHELSGELIIVAECPACWYQPYCTESVFVEERILAYG